MTIIRMRPTDEDIFYRIHGKESDKECRPCQSLEFAEKIDLLEETGLLDYSKGQ